MGSWVREAAMEALPEVFQALVQWRRQGEGGLESVVSATVRALLQQSVERMSRIREVSCAWLS